MIQFAILLFVTSMAKVFITIFLNSNFGRRFQFRNTLLLSNKIKLVSSIIFMTTLNSTINCRFIFFKLEYILQCNKAYDLKQNMFVCFFVLRYAFTEVCLIEVCLNKIFELYFNP